jgi:hypothetical protein
MHGAALRRKTQLEYARSIACSGAPVGLWRTLGARASWRLTTGVKIAGFQPKQRVSLFLRGSCTGSLHVRTLTNDQRDGPGQWFPVGAVMAGFYPDGEFSPTHPSVDAICTTGPSC